jgi:hypothetical protein
MTEFIKVAFFILVVLAFESTAYGDTLECKFKDHPIRGINSIEISDESLVINSELEIPLEKSLVKCGTFGKQIRFDGSASGLQVVLKSCSTEAKLEGHLIDSLSAVAADVFCNSVE